MNTSIEIKKVHIDYYKKKKKIKHKLFVNGKKMNT